MSTTTYRKPFFADFGSISHATMRPEDLIPCFIETLDELKGDESLSDTPNKERYERIDNILADIEQRMKAPDYYESEGAAYDLNETLFDLLDEYAPPLGYFGSHPGDGSDYGFWLSEDAIEEAAYDGSLVRIEAGDSWPDDLNGVEYVAEITDHGNVTLYDAKTHTELWAIV